jgi:PHS family inorganic phosphate transporter-like MFS transporter
MGTLYQRLTLPESARYLASQKRPEDAETFEKLKTADEKDVKVLTTATDEDASNKSSTKEDPDEIVQKKAHFPGKRILDH